MGILSRLAVNRVSAAAQQTSAALTLMSPELMRWFSSQSSSGKHVTEQSMMSVSAAWACRRILTESVGMLPWSMFRKESNGNAEKADDHQLQDVLVYSPNRDQTSVEYRESLAMGLTGDGNAYSVIERLGKRITSLTPIFGVEPNRKQGSNTREPIAEGEVFFRFSDRGKPTDLPREKIWQVKGYGPDLLKGLSPIRAAREAIGGALAQEDFANKFFSQGGMPAGTVSYPGWLTKEQRDVAREALQKMIGGLGKAHQFAMFEGGVKPEPWNTMNMEEMQFIFGRKFSVLEICRFYRVPPHMVAELEKGASYASIEQMSMEFVMFTLMPYLTRFEASVTKWLLPAEERRKFYLRFNYEGLLRADSKGRAEMYASAVRNGWMKRNEARAKENWNRSEEPGMDDFTVEANLVRVQDLGKMVANKEAAPQKPAPPPENRSITVSVVSPRQDAGMPEMRAAVAVLASGQREFAEKLAGSQRRIADRLGSEQARIAERLAAIWGRVLEHAKAGSDAAALQAHADEIRSSLESLVKQIGEGQKQIAGLIRDDQRQLTEQILEGHKEVAAQLQASCDAMSDGLETLASQERQITIDGETFISKPVGA